MGTLLFILCFIVSTIGWDIFAKIRLLFVRKDADDFWNRFLKTMGGFSLWLARFYAGLKLEQESAVPLSALPPRFLLVTNHQSLGDIVILICAFPGHDLKYAAKKELKWGIPAVSTILRRGNHAFVKRKGGFSDSMRSIKKLIHLRGEHICPVIFPEGTRSRTGKLGQFHTAGCRVILDNSDLPVVSAAVEGGYKVQKFMDFFTKLRGLVYRIKILKVYPHASGKNAVSELIDRIAGDIENQLAAWRKSD